jgi:hypothetical protein
MVHQVHQAADVTPLLLAAWEHHQEWSHPLVVSLLERLQLRFEGSQIDWEPGDEEWGRLLVDGQAVVLVCSRMPLAIIESLVFDHLRRDLPDELMVLSVPSLSTPVLMVDRKVAESMFDRELSDNVDWGGMSASDFWWATV